MTTLVTVWLILTIILGGLTMITVWARTAGKLRALSVVAFLLASPVAAGALISTLGLPLPLIEGLTIHAGRHQVIGVKLMPEEGIYVYIDSGDVPRSYVLPWDVAMAESIQQAQESAGQDGEFTMETGEFQWPWEGEAEGNGESGEGGEGDEGETAGVPGGGDYESSFSRKQPRFGGHPPARPAPKPSVQPGFQFGG